MMENIIPVDDNIFNNSMHVPNKIYTGEDGDFQIWQRLYYFNNDSTLYI